MGSLDPNSFGRCGGRRDIFFVTVLISRGLTLIVLSGLLKEESWKGDGGRNFVLLVSLGLVFIFLVLELLSELCKLKFFLLELSLLLLLFQEFLAPLLALGVTLVRDEHMTSSDVHYIPNTHIQLFLEFTSFLFLA